MISNSGTIPASKEMGASADFKTSRSETNPFKLPGDDQIFRMREEEKKKRVEEREQNRKLRIWEKQSAGVTSRTTRLRELVGEDDAPMTLTALAKSESKPKPPLNSTTVRRQEKENMVEFIAKKREMFLVQMSLDTKRGEIRKLEEKAQMKEEALQRSEQMLEEDAARFDAFLKENDKKAHDAIKRAEEETKRKQEKIQEIKRLTQQIQTLTSEMSKHKEALEDCMRYKKFLDMLTPPEFFEQHRKNLQEKRERTRRERYEKKMREWESLRRRLLEQHRKENESKKEKKMKSAASSVQEQEDEDDLSSRLSIPPPPRLEDEPYDNEEEEPPMYFTQPHQLMDLFAALEEQNLFLIQNSQETEHTLEELRQDFKKTKLETDARTGELQKQIDDLQAQIEAEEMRARSLQAKRVAAIDAAAALTQPGNKTMAQINGQTQQEKERLLDDLHAKVHIVYEQCGFDASSKPSTLYMLSQLESKLEVLLADIETMPTEYVIRAEREKEKKRRERKREEQQALQEKLQEERNKRAIERSLQAPKKRVGRQVMFRSKPVRQERKSAGDENTQENNDELKYLS